MIRKREITLEGEKYIRERYQESSQNKEGELESKETLIKELEYIIIEGDILLINSIPNKEGEIKALHTNKNNKGKKSNLKWKRGKNNQTYKNRYFSKIQCYICDKFGHTHRYYPKRKKDQASIAKVNLEKHSLFFLALSSELNSNKNTWIIDRKSSQHIISFKD